MDEEEEVGKERSKYRVFSDGWCSAFKDRFGGAYPYNGRDGKAAAEILKTASPEDLLAIAAKAWEQTDPKKFWNCVNQSSSVPKFATALATIRVELSRIPKRPNGVSGDKW